MGPLASAEFVKTIYDFNIGAVEQEAPVCILYSDPTIPDRTEAILNGTEELLLEHLVHALDALYRLGADKIVIACITIHHLLPKVPLPLRRVVISLIDLIVDEVLATDERYLLLCTKGSRQAGIFQNNDRWDLIKSQVVFTSEADQYLIHELIQKKLKTNEADDSVLSCFDDLVQRYRMRSFIAGCTEIHLLVKLLMKRGRKGPEYDFVDPLLTVARDFHRLLNGSVPSIRR
jgi:aspartate racemase